MLGPFGAGVLSVLIPQVRDDLGTTTAAVTAGITVYMVPFAALQLVSGTVGERLGRRRVVFTGYVFYALFMVAGALAPGRSIDFFSAAIRSTTLEPRRGASSSSSVSIRAPFDLRLRSISSFSAST